MMMMILHARLHAVVPGLPAGPHCLPCHCLLFQVILIIIIVIIIVIINMQNIYLLYYIDNFHDDEKS